MMAYFMDNNRLIIAELLESVEHLSKVSDTSHLLYLPPDIFSPKEESKNENNESENNEVLWGLGYNFHTKDFRKLKSLFLFDF